MARLAGKRALITEPAKGCAAPLPGSSRPSGPASRCSTGIPPRRQRPLAQIEGDGGTAVAITADVADLDAVARAVRQAADALG